MPPQVERLFEMSRGSIRCLLLEARREDAVLQAVQKLCELQEAACACKYLCTVPRSIVPHHLTCGKGT